MNKYFFFNLKKLYVCEILWCSLKKWFKEIETDRYIDRQRYRERQGVTERDRERHRETQRNRKRHTERKRDREKNREAWFCISNFNTQLNGKGKVKFSVPQAKYFIQ